MPSARNVVPLPGYKNGYRAHQLPIPASHFAALTVSSIQNENYHIILSRAGQVEFPEWPAPPDLLKKLLLEDNKEAKDFRRLIRAYNNVLAFTSSGATVNRDGLSENHAYRYVLQSALYHKYVTRFVR